MQMFIIISFLEVAVLIQCREWSCICVLDVSCICVLDASCICVLDVSCIGVLDVSCICVLDVSCICVLGSNLPLSMIVLLELGTVPTGKINQIMSV